MRTNFLLHLFDNGEGVIISGAVVGGLHETARIVELRIGDHDKGVRAGFLGNNSDRIVLDVDDGSHYLGAQCKD